MSLTYNILSNIIRLIVGLIILSIIGLVISGFFWVCACKPEWLLNLLGFILLGLLLGLLIKISISLGEWILEKFNISYGDFILRMIAKFKRKPKGWDK